MSNSKKQKDQSDLVNEKVEVSPVSESDAAASKEEDPFHTAVESITSSPVTSEKEAEEYVSNQTFAAANEHEMQALISILEGEAPADRKAILKALVQREKLKEGAGKKTDVNENELNEDWKHGGYPYKNRMSRKIYEKEKYLLQVELLKLQNWVKETGQKVVILFEGRDAAGKGGNIKRVTGALDPRGYEVQPIASPEPHEKARHYLWRFWTRLPKDGHIAIFDRTWYGRVMVERLEGFCSENDWKRAYNEINEFEKELHDWGAVIIKFWVQIDKDTQLERFTERQNNPEKQWKITDEDWRNREKWDQYEEAVNEMLKKTSTTFAPWHILESVDKKYARIKALKIIIKELEKALK